MRSLHRSGGKNNNLPIFAVVRCWHLADIAEILICEAKFGTLFLYDANTLRVAAGVGTPPELVEFERRRGPFRLELGSHLERVVGTKQVIHIIDDATEDVPRPPTRLAGARSFVAVPMLKDD